MTNGLRRAMLAALLLLAVQPGIAAARTSAPIPGPGVFDPLGELESPGDGVRLSDERKLTRWVNANTRGPIRTAARKTAHTITRLRYFTEDGLREVYLVLDGKLDRDGLPWLHIRIPMRPNGHTGWVPADDLSQLHVVRTHLVIDRTAKRATLSKNGRVIWTAPVGIGKVATPTPRGDFYVRERLRGDGKVFGTWAFGTSAYSSISDWPKGGVVGIHGTNMPQLIPGRPSHGCVRVRNPKISRLARLMPIGTPVSIVR